MVVFVFPASALASELLVWVTGPSLPGLSIRTTTFTFGAHAGFIQSREVDRYAHLRFDVAMRYLISASIRTGIGLALTRNDTSLAFPVRLGGELRLTFEWLRPD